MTECYVDEEKRYSSGDKLIYMDARERSEHPVRHSGLGWLPEARDGKALVAPRYASLHLQTPLYWVVIQASEVTAQVHIGQSSARDVCCESPPKVVSLPGPMVTHIKRLHVEKGHGIQMPDLHQEYPPREAQGTKFFTVRTGSTRRRLDALIPLGAGFGLGEIAILWGDREHKPRGWELVANLDEAFQKPRFALCDTPTLVVGKMERVVGFDQPVIVDLLRTRIALNTIPSADEIFSL